MARDILIRLNKLSASGKIPAESTVTFQPTVLRTDADGMILPVAFDVELVDGEGTATGVPESDLNWAYWVQINNGKHGRWSWYVAVPEGTGVINFEDLPRIDPKTLTPINDPDPAWVAAVTDVFATTMDTEIDARVPVKMVEGISTPGPVQTALNAQTAQAVWDVPGPRGTIADDTAMVLAACTLAESEGRTAVTMAPGHYQLDGLTVRDIKNRYLTGDGVTFSPDSWVYPFSTDDTATMSANRGRTTGHGRLAIEVDDALITHWHYLFPATKRLGITVGTAWHTDNGAKWVAEAYRHGWEVMSHHPTNIVSTEYNSLGTLDAAAESALATIEAEIGTRDNIGFVYPQHVRDEETDRILSKYFTRGRGIAAARIYPEGSGHPWLTASYPLDANFTGGVISDHLRSTLRKLATLGGGMVVYMHLNAGNYAGNIAALTELVNECRHLGIDIVNPGQIWGDRNIVEDSYFTDPGTWLLGSKMSFDTVNSYHGGRSVKVSGDGTNPTAVTASSTSQVKVSPRPGMFGVYRASVRYRADSDVKVTSHGQGLLMVPSIRYRTIDGGETTTFNKSITLLGPKEGTILPAAQWARLQSLIYIPPDVSEFTPRITAQNIGAGHPDLWLDEVKIEHVDWVSSITYTATLIGTGNVFVTVGIPSVERYDVQVIPQGVPAGRVHIFGQSNNTIIVKSTDPADTMNVRLVISPGSSYEPGALSSAGA